MLKFNFENLHPSKRWAFIDGVLCGAYLAFSACYVYYNYRQEMDALARAELIADMNQPETTE